ncbi:SDR family NAD(P)-dependent oxidoreductase [Lacipirellula limnantheis]|uniref:2-(R)-hydroxypropyl-CoM dehydrogenase n=1 Tax=Lacipirellula limnantheis TaxID=2528024 RepID=A0A517TSZ1_9BACT|nr:SDR family oxidoreductase [Lacipirellula limnantheis]QDT71497.1 2-(R)-hydroxypropyl-CoM dehydrogenase [Lacipirellula limnantheis]
MRTVVITGAGSGIGRAIAVRQGAAGDRVVVLERDLAAGEETVAAVRAAEGVADAMQCDVGDADSVAAAFARLERVDALVNNAGIAHVGNVEKTSPEDFDRLFRVNVRGVYHCLHAAIPRMRFQGGGVVLNMASIAAKLGIRDRFAYSMTKGAVLSMTLSVARDYVAENIRCNCICPARVHTPFVDGYIAKNYPEAERRQVFETLSAYQPIGRMGRPEEIAALAHFLLSEEAAFITGVSYDIDGGVTQLR